MKRLISTLAAVLCCALALAQGYTGGVKGTVVNRQGRVPVAGAKMVLSQNGITVASQTSAADGTFLIQGLADGMYDMTVTADEFTDIQVNVTVDQGFIKDLIFVSMVPAKVIQEADASNFAEFDMEDSGYSDNPTILFAANDVYTNVAGFGFSNVRFKNRGYNSETQDVMLSGIKLNDAVSGFTPFSLWTGLNEVMRSKDSSIGLSGNDFGIGGYNGVTNIYGNPSKVRPGLRISALTNSAMYRMRLMVTYATGVRDDGWSYVASASVRAGGNDWIQGVYYRNFAYYLGAEKQIDDEKTVTLFTFATPGQRGAQNASTQEVYDLMGDNMYNSNWGYQNGKMRNARVRKTFEPVTVAKFEYKPSLQFQSTTTFLWRTGKNGYTALDWYDAQDPRPDYYRNLPSYAYMADEDYGRSNIEKSTWLAETWNTSVADYVNYQHINWDMLYNVNYASYDARYSTTEHRSHYAQEERHVDQNDFNLAETIKWRPSEELSVVGGARLRFNRTEYYKKMADLLGGDYFLNVDSFAERDFAISDAKIQQDLDYWEANGHAQYIRKGDKYGYDYFANVIDASVWANGEYVKGNFSAFGAASIGYNSFWREGVYRKGLFAGLKPDGSDYIVNGVNLTARDSQGNVVTSQGKSEVLKFIEYSAKAGAAYIIKGGHRISVNAGYFNDAPTFNEAFISARTRNSIVPNLDTKKTFSGDVNYQYSNAGYNLRVTGFYTTIKDQTDVMSFYDDSQNSFTNFAMSGIDQRHMGIEFGAKMPLPVKNLTLSGVLSLGEYIYTSNPYMVQTIDNSAETIREGTVKYWMNHPDYVVGKKLVNGDQVVEAFDQDADGNYKIAGYKKHYVPSTPQLAAELALNYNWKYWFFELNGQYFAHSYLDMNPLYRTEFATAGADKIETPEEVVYMASQEEFAPVFLLNASIGKSWYIHNNQIGFSLNLSNLTNNKGVKTGGYEQTRLINSTDKDRYYRFDSKYFYMAGFNYMLNIYFRF